MLLLKVAIYSATMTAAMFFAFWELRLKKQLTDDAVQPVTRVSDLGIMSDISERVRREQVLKELPKQVSRKLRIVIMFKFWLVATLIAEVIILQR